MGRQTRGGESLVPCVEDPEAFFPSGYLGKAGDDTEETWQPDYHSEAAMAARAKCAGCPLRIECLEGAKQRQEPYGIWGGLDPNEIVREVYKDAMRMR